MSKTILDYERRGSLKATSMECRRMHNEVICCSLRNPVADRGLKDNFQFHCQTRKKRCVFQASHAVSIYA